MTVQQSSRSEKMLATSDGTRLRVDEAGPADAPVTVVLAHGWTLTRHTWDHTMRSLHTALRSPARIVRYDQRGHGESDRSPSGTATIRQCADDLADVIADLVPSGPIVLAGHSMGAMTLMALAERHPELVADRVRGVALVGTSSGLGKPSFGLPKPLAALINAGERKTNARLAASRAGAMSTKSRWLRPGLRWLLFGNNPSQGDVAATAEWVAACHPASLAGFRESLAEHERTEALAAFRAIPVMILSGLADRLCPPSHSRRMARALPEAELVTYPGCGHMIPLERPEEVTARIADIVRRAQH